MYYGMSMKRIIAILSILSGLLISACTQCTQGTAGEPKCAPYPKVLNAEAAKPMYSQATLYFNYANGAPKKLQRDLVRQPDGAWRVKISKEEINAEKNLNYIDILIPAAYAKVGEEGYFINTMNMIGTYRMQKCGYTSGGKNSYAFFGAKNPRATWSVIMKSLELETSMAVSSDKGNYQVFPRIEVARMEGTPAYEDAVLDFYPLDSSASYADMAKIYRNYQIARGEVVPLKERIKGNPKLERLAKSILLRIAHGSKPIPKDKNGKWIAKDYTVETELPMSLHCTFQQGTDAIKYLKQAGCDYCDIQEVGWNIRGHDGRYPQLFPAEPAAGGDEKLKETVATAKKLGYNISAHVNHTDAYTVADCWNEDYIAKRKDGSMMYVGCWAGGKAYTPCPAAIFDRFVKKDYVKIRDYLGMNGFQHVDVISAITPRICHDPRHPLNRRQWTNAYLKIMKYGHDVSGGFTSECGLDHVIKYLDWAFYINHSEHKPKCFDRFVPVWQLVYHGIVPSEQFFSDTGTRKNINRLHHAEFGGRPVFYGGWLTKEFIDTKLKPLYDEYQKVSYLQMEFMDDHKQLADGVYLTVYGNGDEVVTNYSDFTYEYKGQPVFHKDYRLFKKQK